MDDGVLRLSERAKREADSAQERLGGFGTGHEVEGEGSGKMS